MAVIRCDQIILIKQIILYQLIMIRQLQSFQLILSKHSQRDIENE